MNKKIISEKEIKEMLASVKTPKLDINAKKTAINTAINSFDEAQEQLKLKKLQKNAKKFQGNTNNKRQKVIEDKNNITNKTLTLWRRIMKNQFKIRTIVGAVAASALLIFIGGPLILDGYKTPMTTQIAIDNKEVRTKIEENLKTDNSRPAKSEDIKLTNDSNEGKKQAIVKPAPIATAQKSLSQEYKLSRTKPVEYGLQQGRHKLQTPLADAYVDSVRSNIARTPDIIVPPTFRDIGRDKFKKFDDNPVKLVAKEPVSTFSIDVDTASYAFTRNAILNRGVLPPKNAVRVEEFINYFDYNYPVPSNKTVPFKPTVTMYDSPWKKGNKLIHIGIKAYDIDKSEKPKSNLVFLLDTSGSMSAPNKLPLLINSMKLLVENLQPDDSVAIVTYAGNAGVVLKPTKVSDKYKIISALESLRSGGSTAGAEGIKTAYELIEHNFDKQAVNRVILATDGDFNVGITNPEELQDFIERKRKTGVFLSVLGFGHGNYNDDLMQRLAQKGNGNAAYIDTLKEARKILVEEANSTFFTVAKDVKIQVEFNPSKVAEYRLIGYETRKLNREDFNNDKIDAGEIGAGHSVTAIYEITPVDAKNSRLIDDLRYEKTSIKNTKAKSKGKEYAFLKIRYKLPKEDKSRLIARPIDKSDEISFDSATDDIRFAAAVAAFGQKLRGGKYIGDMSYDDIINIAKNAKDADEFGYRAEFIDMVRLAKTASTISK